MSTQIQISPMPQPLLQFLVGKGLTTPKMCFNNCFLGVMNDFSAQRFRIEYVLGWVTHPEDNIRTSHAFLKSDNSFYDPTLEPLGMQDQCRYEVGKVFTREELMHLLVQKFDQSRLKKMIDGQEPWWPLCQTTAGGYEFVDAPLPTAY
jgi:hypothetical protein